LQFFSSAPTPNWSVSIAEGLAHCCIEFCLGVGKKGLAAAVCALVAVNGCGRKPLSSLAIGSGGFFFKTAR
jgi:hypothetical protein